MVSLAQFEKQEPPTFKQKQAEEFLALFPGNELIVCRKENEWHKPRSEADLMKFGAEWLNSELNIQFLVNEGVGRKDADIQQIRAIWADFDNGKPLQKTWPLKPSIIVQSSPGKWHVYWLVQLEGNPQELKEEWRAVMTGIVETYEADPGSVSLSRVLRVPGTYNFSTKYPHPEEVLMLDSNGTEYHWSEICKHFPPLYKSVNSEAGVAVTGGSEFNEHELFRAFLNGDSICPSLNRLIMHWAYHYSAVKIKMKVNQLESEVPLDIKAVHSDRYFKALSQADKFIKTAKNKVAAERANQSDVVRLPVKLKPMVSKDMVDYMPIPKEGVPELFNKLAQATHNYIGNGIEPALISAVGVTSILLNKNVRIHEIGEETTTYCTTGVMLAMSTGARKTALYKVITKPVTEYETLLREQWEIAKNGIKSQEYMIDQQIDYCEKEIKKAAAKGSGLNEMKTFGETRARLLDQRDALQTELPSLYVQDTTEAAVVDIMAKNNGTIAVMTDEGRNFVKNVLGRFESKGGDSAEGWVTNGMGGKQMKTNRKGGGEIIIDDPCLNVFAMIQPDKATEFKDHKAYKESGMAARLPVYHYPTDDIAMMEQSDRTRLLESEPVERYYNVMKELCVKRADKPMIVELTKGAQKQINAFNQRIVQLLKTSWNRDTNRTNKIITQAVVLGTVMAAADDPVFRLKLAMPPENGVRYQLSAKYINMGGIYAEALYEGMLKSTDSLDNMTLQKAALSLAKSLIIAMQNEKIYEGFSNNSYLQQKFGPVTSENRDGVIEMLVDHGWVTTEKNNESRELNKGFPGGKSHVGDTIYHLDLPGVIAQIKKQELEDEKAKINYTR